MRQISSNNRIRILLLLVLVVIAGICASVGVTYSRYINDTSQYVVYDEADYTWGFDASGVSTAGVAKAEVLNPEEAGDTSGKLEQIYFDKSCAALRITYPEGADSAVISADGSTFLPGTCYSTDGIHGTTLNAKGCIEIAATDSVISIKFNNMSPNVLKVSFCKEEEILDEVTLELVYDESRIFYAQELETVVMGLTGEGGRGGSVTWQIPDCIPDSTIGCEVFHVTPDGLTFVDSNEVLPVTVAKGDNHTTVTVSNPADNKADAGTYKIIITRKISTEDGKEVELMSISKAFFVNYR